MNEKTPALHQFNFNPEERNLLDVKFGSTDRYSRLRTWCILVIRSPFCTRTHLTAKEGLMELLEQQWDGKTFEQRKDILPLVSAGINHKSKAVEIVLHTSSENSPDNAKYIALIQNTMPDDVNWFVSYGEYAVPENCPETRCDAHNPVIGGIEIRGDGDGKCTMGWKATKSGKTGFVTAGHCMDNSINKDVYQPSSGVIHKT